VEVSKKMDFNVLEFNGEADHIHALIEFPPKLSVSKIMPSKGYLVTDTVELDTPNLMENNPYGVLVTLYLPLVVRRLKFLNNTFKINKTHFFDKSRSPVSREDFRRRWGGSDRPSFTSTTL
jgi:REP element-mobilizing transposase RayT